MATDNNNNKSSKPKKRQRYLPHNKPVKKKGAYPLRPGVRGFFITCNGGKERQASHEAINVLDSFYEELVQGKESAVKLAEFKKPMNKKIRFESSESSDGDDDDDEVDDGDNDNDGETGQKDEGDKQKPDADGGNQNDNGTEINAEATKKDGEISSDKKVQGSGGNNEEETDNKQTQEFEAAEPPTKKQCLEPVVSRCENVPGTSKLEEKSVDKLIEEEIAELGDRSKRLFSNLDTGCNGVVFIQMRKRDGDLCPKTVVQHMMTSLASSKKHVSRFMLRVLPVEVTCYASDEEIMKSIKPLIALHFPVETQTPHKFAVLYDARANTGIDRMKIINAVAKSVPPPHNVDLSNPDINIVVQIVKTVCLIGVVEKYKELAKYNLRQLTSKK